MLLPVISRFEHILKSVTAVATTSVLKSLALEIGFKSIQSNFTRLHISPSSPIGFLTKLAHLIPLLSVKIKHTDELSPPPGKGVK